jgi:VacB/RNase II family 3'-5' exoribonuclease
MSHHNGEKHSAILRRIARRVMLENGLLTDFSVAELEELNHLSSHHEVSDPASADLRSLCWCSIDNNDSRDLDQLTYAEKILDGKVKVLVAVADVDSLVKRASALDKHAGHNTTSIYTAAEVFPMLPEKLSTDLTSLNFSEDRNAVVVELHVSPDGSVSEERIFAAKVRSHAKLAYSAVADWLENGAPLPKGISEVPGLESNLRLQDHIAQQMKELRHERGALEFETIHAQPVFDSEMLKDLVIDKSNRAKDIIADFMIAANTAVARFLDAKGFPSLRRVVRVPERWERIVELARERGYMLPDRPEPKALNAFLVKERKADPETFSDLSLSVIKLLGNGEYIVDLPESNKTGHFGLAVKDYTHSTAPNRRYPDLLTQRLVKAALQGSVSPYSTPELLDLADHCTRTEDMVKKIERQVDKSAAALLLEHRIGEYFEAIVTGAADKGTWVRLLRLPVEGKLVDNIRGVDVGLKIRVRLVHTDVEQGHIDFV